MAVRTSTLDGGIGLIEVRGDLIGGTETDKLRQAITGFIERDYKKLVIDLSKVTYINSTGIGVLVAGYTSFSRKDGQIRLCGLNNNVTNVFVITKLTLVFEVCDTRDEAVKALS